MCIKNLTEIKEKEETPARCWRCGRLIYEDVKTGRSGCRNTKCHGYLLGSKNWDRDRLRIVTVKVNVKNENKS